MEIGNPIKKYVVIPIKEPVPPSREPTQTPAPVKTPAAPAKEKEPV